MWNIASGKSLMGFMLVDEGVIRAGEGVIWIGDGVIRTGQNF